MRVQSLIWILVLALIGVSCYENHSENKNKETIKDSNKKSSIDSLKLILEENIIFIGDSILGGNKNVIRNYIYKYQNDTCGIQTYDNNSLKETVLGVKEVGDINNDSKSDTIFIVPSFNYCDEGQSYCFFDNSIPRLYTESNCCHLENFFTIGDIDEDGILEIGIYYSSCVSRFKSLIIFSLKNGKWIKIGASTFDIFTQDPEKITFKSLVKKIKKKEFKVCNFEDGRTTWITFKMK